MTKVKRICMFCASSDNIDNLFIRSAKEMASLLANDGFELIFGGGTIGLMGEVAKVFKKNNKKVISVIPKKLNKKGIVFEGSNEIKETNTMNERKTIMEKLSNAFIALPGGFGTLEEILEIITLKQLKYHNKPIAFLNTGGFYDFLFKQLEVFYEKKFVKEKYRDLYFVSNDPFKVLKYITNS